MTLTLTPGKARLADLARLYRQGEALRLDPSARPAVEAAVDRVNAAAQGEAPVYGVNTGFGKLAHVRIPAADTTQLQRNLILSHCAGVGPALPERITRLTIALKLLSLGRGASGARWEVIETLQALLERNVTPVIPAQGSVGASGDLAPLAHLTAVMLGEGEADYQGSRMPAAQALAAAGIVPLTLGPKEGLALINGTQVSTALALAGLFDAWRLGISSLVTGAMSTDAAMASPAPFRPEIHELRGHRGQIEAAAALRALLEGSEIREAHRDGDERVQDPYSIRCQPQVAGAALDLLRQSAATLEIEANAVTDNPLVLADGAIVSGGNFHAEPVAFAADQMALAIAELGAIAQRRIALLVDPNLNFHLPAFLSPEPGLNSGFMIAEVTSAALMSENKALAHPSSVDSLPTSANQEDHVSMAAYAARRLVPMADNSAAIVAIELLAAAQGLEFRRPLKSSEALERAHALIRVVVPALDEDRYMAPDIEAAKSLVQSGAFDKFMPGGLLPSLGHGAINQVH